MTQLELARKGVILPQMQAVAEQEGVEIEYVTVDPEGNASGEPRTARSGWVELRDHASFPAANATRETAVRPTPLGMLDGWLYTVRDEAGGTTSEFFFADSLPGAPLQLRQTRGDELVMELEQVARSRPGDY